VAAAAAVGGNVPLRHLKANSAGRSQEKGTGDLHEVVGGRRKGGEVETWESEVGNEAGGG
jgi:hypothetical protein